MLLFLLLNVILTKSQDISICKNANCDLDCKTYSTPICITEGDINLFFSSENMKIFSDQLCTIPIINISQPLIKDNKCHGLNNTYYFVIKTYDNSYLFVLPLFFLIISGMLYFRSSEKNREKYNQMPMMRD